MGFGCCGVTNFRTRSFLTKEERIDLLKEYKEDLEQEAKGVGENIKDLEKSS